MLLSPPHNFAGPPHNFNGKEIVTLEEEAAKPAQADGQWVGRPHGSGWEGEGIWLVGGRVRGERMGSTVV